MDKKTYSLKQKIYFSLFAFFFMFLIILGVGEIVARIVQEVKPEPAPPYNTVVKDDFYGWKCKPNYRFDGEMKDASDVPYQVHYFSDDRGFKHYPSKDSLKKAPTVWFIGDSYVQAVEIANSDAFYTLVDKQLPMNMYAAGMSGWGNYQEYLMMDKYFDEIKPDIIIWEVCTNDCIDNLEALEMECVYRLGLKRPYLREDGTSYDGYPVSIHKKISECSKLYEALYTLWAKAETQMAEEEHGEYKIAHQKRDYKLYDDAMKVTEKIFEKIKQRVGPNVKIYILDTSTMQPFHEDWQKLGAKLGIKIIESVPDSLNAAKAQHKEVHSKDGWHWNPLGHKIVAESVIAFLKQEVPFWSAQAETQK